MPKASVDKDDSLPLWEHDIWRDDAAGGPALSIFRRLFEIGYREAVIFDNEGDYIQTLALDASQ